MYVFFQGTYQAQKQFGENYKKIFDEIKELGYSHVSDDIINLGYKEYLKMMEKGREAQVENYNRNMHSIKKADICIFETSAHSLGVGFLAQKSLDEGKPTIVLYYGDNTPYFLSGVDDEKLIVRSYTEKTLRKILKESLETARERRDKRFNFFLSPKLLEYLEDASTKEGVTKSKLIRDMIVNHMRKSSGTSTGVDE